MTDYYPHHASGTACRDLHLWGEDHEPLEPCIQCAICHGWVRPEHMNLPCMPRTRNLFHPTPLYKYADYSVVLWALNVLMWMWVLFH